MKKWAILLAAASIALVLFACTKTDDTVYTMGEGLNVGYAKIDITPDFSVGLGGYGNAETRRSKKILDRIYATCIAITEDEETILVYTIDNCAITQSFANQIREKVTAATNVPGDNIFCSATHSHSCPSLSNDDAGVRYQELLLEATVEAAQTALADRTTADVLATTAQLEGLNFVRHYEMSDGTYAGSNFGSFTEATIVGHATEADSQMVLVKFDRPGQKQDVLLVNWQAHPDHSGQNGFYKISADFPGAMRDRISEKTGMLVAYFTGASGNQNPNSKIKSEAHNLSMKQYGKKLADQAIAALDDMQPVEGTGINATCTVHRVFVDQSWNHKVIAAKQVYNLWKSEGKEAADALGKFFDFTSCYQASAIITRSQMDPFQELELRAFRIHGIGFVSGTYEMFSNASLYIKEHSPYDTTFIITGNHGYIPAAEAYDYRSYEADTGYYARGASEVLAERFVELLNSLQ